MIEWGSGFGGGNADAKVVRIDYVGGNRAPVAVASATPNNGSVPLSVQFSSAGTYDPDLNDTFTLAWSFFGDGITNSTDAAPSFVYAQPGNYNAQLIVTDSQGNQTVANVPITAGNNRPVVSILDPPNGAFFDWTEAINYRLSVSDVEDGSTGAGTIACSNVIFELNIGHNDHAHSVGQFAGCSGQVVAPPAHSTDVDNLFLVLAGSYTDRGAPNVAPLIGRTTYILNTKHKQAEYFTHSSGIQTQATTDPLGGGLDVVGIDHGDYITYSPMNFTNITGVMYRVAASGAGGRIEIHADSPAGPLVSTANIAGTGGVYTNVTTTLTDPGGTHEYYFVFLRNPGDTGLFVLNWMEFSGDGISLNQSPYGGTPRAIPGTIQAEDFDLGGEGVAYHDTDTSNNGGQYRPTEGVDIESTTDTGGGYDVGWTLAGEWMEYTVNVASSGVYKLEVRFASQGNGGNFHIELDGVDKTGSLAITNTGGWQIWQTLVRSNVALNAGQHILRLSSDAIGASGNIGNLNYLRFTLLSNNIPPAVTITNPVPNAVFGAPAMMTLKATASDADGSISKVEFFANGSLIGTSLASPFNFVWTNVPAGYYTLTARATDNVGLNAISGPINIDVINGQAPFYGLPQTIPGTIQAEDFDGGGEGVSYHDTDAANNGNQYRATSVDIENAGDTGGGYDVGWTAGGEWLKYTINAIVDGVYILNMRVASQGNAGTFHVEIDGQNVTGAMTVNDTGGWQIYQTLTKTNINISGGLHQLRLSLDASGSNGTVGNYNYMNFAVTSTNPPPIIVQSTAALTSAFLDDSSAAVDTIAKSIVVPKVPGSRFYRLRSTLSTRVLTVQIVGTNVVMTYQ
jgi:PKD repeat protein